MSRAPAFRVDGHLSTNSGGRQQNSKACKARAFEGSNPSATANLTHACPAPNPCATSHRASQEPSPDQGEWSHSHPLSEGGSAGSHCPCRAPEQLSKSYSGRCSQRHRCGMACRRLRTSIRSCSTRRVRRARAAGGRDRSRSWRLDAGPAPAVEAAAAPRHRLDRHRWLCRGPGPGRQRLPGRNQRVGGSAGGCTLVRSRRGA